MKACEVQNSPTLSVVKDDTTSGALGPPARSAWLILSSVMLPTALTVMFGCFFSKAAMLSSMAFTSLGALHPCQNVMVVLAFGSSLAPPPADPVQAAVVRTRATVAAAAARWRWCLDADMGLLLRDDGHVVADRVGWVCRVSKTCSRVASSAVCNAPVSTGSCGTAVSSTGGRGKGRAGRFGRTMSGNRLPPSLRTPPAGTTRGGSRTGTRRARPRGA